MGYISKVSGQLEFTRDITPSNPIEEITPEVLEAVAKLGFDINNLPLPPMGLSEAAIKEMEAHENLSYWFDISEDEADADDSESGKAYEIEEDIQEIIRIAREDGVTVNGTITIAGEEAGDIWRVVVTENKAQKEKIALTWPDGTTYPTRR
jgi:sugar phosphate isomerase/epimerase